MARGKAGDLLRSEADFCRLQQRTKNEPNPSAPLGTDAAAGRFMTIC